MSADSSSASVLSATSPDARVSSGSRVPSSKRSPIRRALSYWWVALIAVFVVLILFVIVFYGGYVTGEEFSPETFQTREFAYYELPLLKLQITGITRSSNTPDAAISLTQKKIINALPESKRWHLVWVTHGTGGRKQKDDASLLVDQLRSTKNGAPAWTSWTNDHPELAAVLWPTVAKLARRELYLLIPRLLELTRDASSPDQLQELIDENLRQEYLALIEDMRAAGKPELADELAAEAKEDFGDLSRQ